MINDYEFLDYLRDNVDNGVYTTVLDKFFPTINREIIASRTLSDVPYDKLVWDSNTVKLLERVFKVSSMCWLIKNSDGFVECYPLLGEINTKASESLRECRCGVVL